jgi:glycosyltransferase involved in cell wall biosynthesis
MPTPERARGLNVHFYQSPMTHESRIMRITSALAPQDFFDAIWIVGTWRAGLADREALDARRSIVRIRWPWEGKRNLAAKVARTLGWMGRAWSLLRGQRVRCVNCHSVVLLPLCVLIKFWKRARLIYDTHELETETASSKGPLRVALKLIEQCGIRFANETIVVGPAIADWYRQRYPGCRVTVVRNIPPARAIRPLGPGASFRERFQIPDAHLVFVYQGGLFRGRRIEQLLRVFHRAEPGRHIVFMGYGELETAVRDAAAERSNIHFLPAVAPEEVLSYSAGADVGMTGVENICLSYFYAMPNKLFEYILAGVPAMVPDFPEMRRVVETHRCGWIVGDDDRSWLDAVNRLTRADIEQARQGSKTASTTLSWDTEEKALLDTYRRLLAA